MTVSGLILYLNELKALLHCAIFHAFCLATQCGTLVEVVAESRTT